MLQSLIVRPSNLKATVGIGKTHAYAKINPKSPAYDPAFPKPVRLSARSVGWRIDDLKAWLDARQRGGDQ